MAPLRRTGDRGVKENEKKGLLCSSRVDSLQTDFRGVSFLTEQRLLRNEKVFLTRDSFERWEIPGDRKLSLGELSDFDRLTLLSLEPSGLTLEGCMVVLAC